MGVVPDHVPGSARSVRPRARTPLKEGRVVTAGRAGAVVGLPARITPVGPDTAVALPAPFRAVTATTIVAPMSTDWMTYDCEVAPAIDAHELPLALQRRHSYVNVSGVEPVHVPLVAKRTEPLVSVPDIDGRNVFKGATPASTAVASETAVAVPKLFVAVTATRSREPRSAEVGVYVLAIAAAMSGQ